MATNDFMPFANGAGANVATLADYSANSGYSLGYRAGVAQSKYLNRTWRQSSIMAAAIGQLIADKANVNAADDGSVTNLMSGILAMLNAKGVLDFQALRAPNGYIPLPGGIIIQWVTASTDGAGNVTFTFPIPFPTAILRDIPYAQNAMLAAAYNVSRTGLSYPVKTGAGAPGSGTCGLIVIGY